MPAQDDETMPPDPAAALLRRVTALVAEHNLAELTIEEDGLTISVRGIVPAAETSVSAMHPQMLTPPISPAALPTPPAQVPVAAASGSSVRIAQESPMVGVFYRAATPEDPPFVSVGDKISVGQPIGLIEAMKVYSELPSEVSGRVVEIAVQNGKLVQAGSGLAVEISERSLVQRSKESSDRRMMPS